jgi:glycosyltransferase involved in cell wall biosynthesis
LSSSEKEEKSKISILMAMYNSENYVTQSIISCLEQTYQNWELLVVDDCSSDNSRKIVKSFNDERIKLFCLDTNSGPAAARNLALEKSTGEWITTLDADDGYHYERLSSLMKLANENGPRHVFCDELQAWPATKEITSGEVKKLSFKKSEKLSILQVGDWLLQQTGAKPFFNRALCTDKNITYNEKLRGTEDTFFLVEICVKNYVSLMVSNSKTYIYRETDGSLSNRGMAQAISIRNSIDLMSSLVPYNLELEQVLRILSKRNESLIKFVTLKETFRADGFSASILFLFYSPALVNILVSRLGQKILYEIRRIHLAQKLRRTS